jgi:hypothetical protein
VLRKSHMDEDEKKMLFNEINILRELVSAKQAIQFKLIHLISFVVVNFNLGSPQHRQNVRILRG